MKRRRRRGSMLVMSLIFSTLLLHAALSVSPLWERVMERSLREERQYRKDRINIAIERYVRARGQFPASLDVLTTAGPYLPRLYDDPMETVTGKGGWRLVLDRQNNIIRIE